MSRYSQLELTTFIEENIVKPFYDSRFKTLTGKTLKDLLKNKNPYLFRTKNISRAQDLSQEMLDAFLSSSEETIFGNLLESLAIFVSGKEFDGIKPREGEFLSIDLIFIRDNTTYIVGIKSGSKWGNSDSTKMMIFNLQNTASEKYFQQNIELVSGICYGKSMIKKCDGYTKYKGQAFWELVSGSETFYIDIVEPIGNAIKHRDVDFATKYNQKINEFTSELLRDFATNNEIDWRKIIEFNSGKV